MNKNLFLCAAMAAVICFTGCNKDGDDDFDDTPGSIDLRRQYCYSLTPGETNDKSLTPPVIEDDIIAGCFINAKAIRGKFFRAKAEKAGGYFVYQFFISPKDKEEWIEVGKITEDEIRTVAEAYYEGVSEINFRGETFFQNSIDLEPESYYNIKIRANYVLNGETTFAESPTNTFFTYFKDNPLVYIQKYTKNSITLAIDNSIYDHYDSIKISMENAGTKILSKDVKTVTFNNLSSNYFYNNELSKYMGEQRYIVEYQLKGNYLHDQNIYVGLHEDFLCTPYEEDDGILEYGAQLYEIKNTDKFKYCIIPKEGYYDNITFKRYNFLTSKKGWHFVTDKEREYFKNNYQLEYNQLVENNTKSYPDEYEILVKNY